MINDVESFNEINKYAAYKITDEIRCSCVFLVVVSMCKDGKCTKSTAHARVGPKLVVFLHSLSPEFRSLALLYVHADPFINDSAYGSISFIILDMSCELFFYVYMLHVLLRATWSNSLI